VRTIYGSKYIVWLGSLTNDKSMCLPILVFCSANRQAEISFDYQSKCIADIVGD
jgi:hypothetical protein